MTKIETIEFVWYAPDKDITQNLDITIHFKTALNTLEMEWN